MNNPFQQFANFLMSQNPNIAQNNAMLQAVINNDEKKGMEIAENLCKSYGVSKEQAIQQATQWYNGVRKANSRFF